jgi:signal transduction histidine kinase
MQASTTASIPLRIETTDLTALLRSALQPLIQQADDDGIELRIDALGAIPALRVDREKLAWVVTVLAGNALRHLRRADAEGIGDSLLVHLAHDEDRRSVVLSVHDDGPGIPPAVLPFLFERRAGKQHALGLALLLVRDVIAAHGGAIEVETRTGVEEHGTSINIVLPVPPLGS